MEWFVLLAPVPTAAVDVSVGSGVTVAVVVAIVTPVMLALRQALRRTDAASATPQLRVIDGGKELGRRAA